MREPNVKLVFMYNRGRERPVWRFARRLSNAGTYTVYIYARCTLQASAARFSPRKRPKETRCLLVSKLFAVSSALVVAYSARNELRREREREDCNSR